jgi:hypothetical protein
LVDDWRFACAFYGCGVIARYDEFISVFNTRMTTPSMTPQALEAVLRAIDRRMADKLGKVAAPGRVSVAPAGARMRSWRETFMGRGAEGSRT